MRLKGITLLGVIYLLMRVLQNERELSLWSNLLSSISSSASQENQSSVCAEESISTVATRPRRRAATEARDRIQTLHVYTRYTNIYTIITVKSK